MSLAPSLLFFVAADRGAYAALPLRSQTVTYEEYARACSLAERLPNHPSLLPQAKEDNEKVLCLANGHTLNLWKLLIAQYPFRCCY